jgi:hypothetical protein
VEIEDLTSILRYFGRLKDPLYGVGLLASLEVPHPSLSPFPPEGLSSSLSDILASAARDPFTVFTV